MGDIAASVLARLKNTAKATGRSNQLCLQLFCQEEFLRRLQKSKYSENFILKGGYYIYAITDFDSRVTFDVDFLANRIPNTPEHIKVILEDIISISGENDFIIFEVRDVNRIGIDNKYTGVRANIITYIKKTRTPFVIDIGIGDVIVPKQEKRTIPTQIGGFDSPIVNTYSIETTIAEKIDAILKLMGTTSRMKDYYDICYIANKFDFDGKLLSEALRRTFEKRCHIYTIEQFMKVMDFAEDISMQIKWKAFVRKTNIKFDDFGIVLQTIKGFLEKPFTATIENKHFTEKWSSVNSKWT
ncbi:MAG: hypothetical protein BWX78_00844 [Firmicutes bacterium ADurb.Bin099]|jgi:predicted nucleotidyltransferase component of viral defense system|nr:MAG: hypothetical protein BWX78_00844 [Firmicutes bacterium ADurb.Bin099]HPY97429.1 nucleotidyl transferase AbiEii/AbiGii toxin family protein [Clostridia bacterium]HQC68738.1 nucleotidyl transferase AbiEii/AbiGii toxin family protein [Clostridia bacterium]